MLTINVTSNIAETIKRLQAQAKQVPFATAVALTKTAQVVRQEEVKEMKDSFDRPTPYTLNSLFVKPATKTDLTARVWLKDAWGGGNTPAARYLLPQITGGLRKLKPFEKMLRSVGALPAGMYAVPGSGAQMDGYGNMSSGQIQQILSYFKTFPEAGYTKNLTKEGREKKWRGTRNKRGFAYFVGRPADGKLPLGIWQRFNFGAMGSAIKPIMIFVDRATYQIMYDFQYIADRTVKREFPRQFEAALRQEMATAR